MTTANNDVITVPIPIELPPGRPRCRQIDGMSADGQCEYAAISAAVGYCYTHRRSHPDDCHQLMVVDSDTSASFARCYDGYHATWRGRIDAADVQRLPRHATSTATAALPSHAKCALIIPYQGLPHQLHVDSPTYKRELDARKKRARQPRQQTLQSEWAEYARANGRAGRKMCIAWHFERDPSQANPNEVVTAGGYTLHQLIGCCADLGITIPTKPGPLPFFV